MTLQNTTVLAGATGAVGRHVAHRLAGAEDVRLLVRDAEKAAGLGLPGRVVRGDYQEAERMKEVLDGAERLFVVTGNPLRPDEDENLLAAALAGGVRHVVKLSGLSVADPHARDVITQWNRDAEDRLRASGLSWTVLRIRALMSNTLGWADSVRKEGVVRAYGGDARNACLDPRDAAEAVVAALDGAEHAGRTYSLTGPVALSPREQVEELARGLGRPVRFEELSAEQVRERWARRYPESITEALLEGTGRPTESKTPLVEDMVTLTGHAPGDYASWLADHVDSFR
ncbi:NAD(P)H-binding protein [Streptomyces sp. HNM0574]|uniref:NAD(P)H-binding protein n=1 Tax=Streptomyces sp. HNM0574 TaxID=2714954 RepID=UPI00146C9083|nr:NAD(P)H-binding protein [Streptomyces sp. HNM0574]NLU68704.1 NAD(P)H-binding protein [Streptomyces sp. HNM0574]